MVRDHFEHHDPKLSDEELQRFVDEGKGVPLEAFIGEIEQLALGHRP